MPKTRVHELAKELGVDIKEIISYLGGLGADVRNQMSTVDDRYAELARRRFTPAANPVPAVEPIKPRPVGMPPRHRSRRPGKRGQTQEAPGTESPTGAKRKAEPKQQPQEAVASAVPKDTTPPAETKPVAAKEPATTTQPAVAKPTAETKQPSAATTSSQAQSAAASRVAQPAQAQSKPQQAATTSTGTRQRTSGQRSGTKPATEHRKPTASTVPADKPADKPTDTERRTPRPHTAARPKPASTGGNAQGKTQGTRAGARQNAPHAADDQDATETPARGGRRSSSGRSGRPTNAASSGGGAGRATGSRTGQSRPGANRAGGTGSGTRPGGRSAARPPARRKPAPVKQAPPEPVEVGPKIIELPDTISVADLAMHLDQPASTVILALMEHGVMAAINNVIDYEVAAPVAEKLGAIVSHTKVEKDRQVSTTVDAESELITRPPVVTILGHVDHGKTTLLDAIREAHVVESEAGGITQHIGAYQVVKNDRKITFLDTPGHEAFTEMRARGAHITDIAILVVAADDGVMPQTIEAINHVKAAGVPIIVAVNKIDRVGANPDRVKQQLSDHGLLAEDWGGDTVMVHVSALKQQGIDDLLEMVLLVADIQDLKANPKRKGSGTVVEAELDKNRGAIATILVQNGTLRTGDALVAGTVAGRIRAMFDYTGKPIKEAGPSMPCAVLGLEAVPEAGDLVEAMDDDKAARQLAEERAEQKKFADQKAGRLRLSELFAKIQEGEIKDLNIVLKADVQGSVEALSDSLEKLSDDDVRINVIHGGTGGITESDVALAASSNAVIIGFNVRPEPATRRAAEREGVDMRLYRIIYDAIDDVKAAMTGMLDPTYEEVVLGRAEVRATFKVPGIGMIAGCYVTDGKIVRNAAVRVLRDSVIIFEGKISSLKRFKDDAREVAEGYECGIGVERYNDIKEHDVLEAYQMQEVKA